MQAVGGQVLRRLRLWPLGEVGRRADDRRAHVRSNAHGDHVLCHHLAGANAGVVAFGDDIRQAVVNDDLHFDVRVVRQQLLQRGPEHGPYRVVVRRDANGAGRLVAQLAQCGQLRLDLLQARPRGPQQALARLGRRDAAGGAGQQSEPKPALEAAKGLAERRLRDTELRGGAGKAAFTRDRQKGHDIVEIGARHSEDQLIGSCGF